VRDYIELQKTYSKFEVADPAKDEKPLKNVNLSLPALSCVGKLSDILHFACVPAQVAEHLHSGKTSEDAWEVWQHARAPHYAGPMSGHCSHITLNLTIGLVEYVPISDEDTRVRLARDLPASAVTIQKAQIAKQHQQHHSKGGDASSGSDDEAGSESGEEDDEDDRNPRAIAKGGKEDDEDDDDEEEENISGSSSESESE